MMFDVAVLGAGPAGLAAAVHACDAGLRVVLIDAGTQPGGQFWRHGEEAARGGHGCGSAVGSMEVAEGAGQHDWKRFAGLRERLYAHESAGRLDYFRGTQLWLVEAAGPADPADAVAPWRLRLTPTSDVAPAPGSVPEPEPVPEYIDAVHVILCPGGYDRQLPVPGWDLPGVMAAGGAQALLKGSQVVPGQVGIVAGTGPFLLPVATALAAAGVRVAAICEANAPTGWLRNVAGVVRAPEKMLEGASYAAALARYRIPYRIGTAVTEIHGTNRVEAVTLSRLDRAGSVVQGSGRRVDCDFVALGWGFTPSLELVLAVGAQTRVDVDGSLIAVVDERLRSSVGGISVAGEATGIGGAAMAVVEGELAALSVAAGKLAAGNLAAGAPVPATTATTAGLLPRIARLQKERARLRTFAVAIHQANPVPRNWHGWLEPDTIVCRCEEVSYGELCRAHSDLGAQDARSLKSFARPGMGWCQGRVCGFATAQIAADLSGRTRAAAGAAEPTAEPAPTGWSTAAEDLRAMSKRTLAAPVSLGHLAALTFPEPESEPEAEAEPERTTASTDKEPNHD